MISAYTAAQIHDAETSLLASVPPGSLMAKAATGAATVILRELRRRRGRATGAKILLLVGAGNNGGDALYAGAVLQRRGVAVTAVAATNRVHDAAWAALRQVGGRMLTLVKGGPGYERPIEDIAAIARSSDGIVDALLGIGSRGALGGHAAGLVTTLTVETGLAGPERFRDPDNRPFILAIDLPSGIGVNDGTVDGPVLPADITVTFGAYKPATFLPPASTYFGQVELVDIGLTPVLVDSGRRPLVQRIEAADVLDLWPVPTHDMHKYTRGVLGVVAGSQTYPGAAVLTTIAAAAVGVGMVRYLGPDKAVERVLSRQPEVVPGGGRVSAWALGPGVAAEATDQLERIRQALKWARSERVPTVIDAGGFAELPDRLSRWMVLTPHAGELSQLLTDRGLPVERSAVEAQPARYAQLAAEMTGATVLLKGPATVIAGQGDSLYVQADATPWLATAGSGDVLTGILGALLAGHGTSAAITPELPAQLTALAAFIHGRAAVAASVARSLCVRLDGTIGQPIAATDVVRALPHTIGELLRR